MMYMNLKSKLLLFTLFFTVNFYCQSTKNINQSAEIYFTSGFEGEIYSIVISNVLVGSNELLHTNPNLSSTSLFYYLDELDKTLKITNYKNQIINIKTKKKYKIKIIDVNKKVFVYTFKFEKGKYLIISKDERGNLQFSQRNVEPQFY
jgi:hypothetical protein